MLVGDGRLGGISVTLAALEALQRRNYPVGAVMVIEEPGAGNSEFLREVLEKSGAEVRAPIPVVQLRPHPSEGPLHEWFDAHDREFRSALAAVGAGER